MKELEKVNINKGLFSLQVMHFVTGHLGLWKYVKEVVAKIQQTRYFSLIGNITMKQPSIFQTKVFTTFLVSFLVIPKSIVAIKVSNPSEGCSQPLPEKLNPGQTVRFNITYEDKNLGPILRHYHIQLPTGNLATAWKTMKNINLNCVFPFRLYANQ